MSLALTCLNMLPKFARVALVRRRLGFSERELDGVVVKLAETPEEALAASHILHRSYVERGLVEPHPSQLRVTPHLLLPTTHTFLAIERGRYVGTLSVVADGALGLPLDSIYRTELEPFRRAGERLAEVGSLAILPAYRKKGIAWLLYRLMYETARAERIDRLVAAVHPRAECLYEAALLFERFGSERCYPGLNRSALAVAIHLDLRNVEERLRLVCQHLPASVDNPYYVCIASHRPEIVRCPPLTREQHSAIASALVSSGAETFGRERVELRQALPSVRFTLPDIGETDPPHWQSAHDVVAQLVPG